MVAAGVAVLVLLERIQRIWVYTVDDVAESHVLHMEHNRTRTRTPNSTKLKSRV